MNKPTVLILFAGGGGDALGFTQSGFDLVYANDNNPDACNTLINQFGKDRIFKGNIRKIDTFKSSNVICGDFPCQGFSSGGCRNINDDRNMLYKELKRAISIVKPEFFVVENVKGFVTLGESTGKFFKDGKIIMLGEIATIVIDELSKLGYNVTYELHNASNYGVPQDRERIIIVGVRDDLNFKFRFPKPLFHQTTMEECGVNLIIENDDEIYRGGKDDSMDYFSSRYMQRDRIRKWTEPSHTITASANQVPPSPNCKAMWKYDIFSNGRPKDKDFIDFYRRHQQDVSPGLHRMSWRQCAAIQGFPLDYEFSGDLKSKYRQIGNAVPPPLMKQIADCIMPYFQGKQSSYKTLVQTTLW